MARKVPPPPPRKEQKAVAVVYIYKSGLVLTDISPEVNTTEQHKWLCEKLDDAKKDILPNG